MAMIKRASLVSAVLLAMSAGTASAQDAKPLLGVGEKIASVGVVIGGDYDGVGIGGAVEYGYMKLGSSGTIGFGGMVAYQRESESFFGEKVTASALPVMFTANAHFGLPGQPKLGLYGGASIGVVRYSVSYTSAFDRDLYDDFGASRTDLGVGVQGGVRFAVSPKTMVHGQLALGDLPLLTAGVSFKF